MTNDLTDINNFPSADELRNTPVFTEQLNKAKQVVLDEIRNSVHDVTGEVHIRAYKLNTTIHNSTEQMKKWMDKIGLSDFLTGKGYKWSVRQVYDTDYRGERYKITVLHISW